MRSDAIHIKVPPGFQADEIPPAQNFESPYGRLAAKWSVKDGELVLEETIEFSDTVAPAAEFPKVRDFFDRVAGVQSAPVVFVRQ